MFNLSNGGFGISFYCSSQEGYPYKAQQRRRTYLCFYRPLQPWIFFLSGMESVSVSVILYPRNILEIKLQSRYCVIQRCTHSTLNLVLTEGSFLHIARVDLLRII